MQPPGSTPGTAGAAGADSAPKMDHAAFLRLYCRLCGMRKIHANQFLHPIQNYKSLISMLHEIDVSTESDQLFPKSACSGCPHSLRKSHANQFLHRIQNYKSLISMLNAKDILQVRTIKNPGSISLDIQSVYLLSLK